MLFVLFLSFSVHAKNFCVYVIGQGELTSPQVEQRFMSRLGSMRARWNRGCQRSITLVGMGKDTYVYDGATNRYLKVNGAIVDGPATRDALANAIAQLTGQAASGDTLKLYLGDHGAVQGTILQGRRAMTPAILRTILSPWVSKGGRVLLMVDHCYSG